MLLLIIVSPGRSPLLHVPDACWLSTRFNYDYYCYCCFTRQKQPLPVVCMQQNESLGCICGITCVALGVACNGYMLLNCFLHDTQFVVKAHESVVKYVICKRSPFSLFLVGVCLQLKSRSVLLFEL